MWDPSALTHSLTYSITDLHVLAQVTKDVWDMLLTFASDISSDLSDYDDDGAWPGAPL